MDTDKTQLIEKLKTATNILVTVSRNPSVDQLAACIGLTLLLNKMDKHATAVFSGEVPSTLEFIQPELTLEKTTDSLRDFIIALDKSKADKLRYKVEDEMVRIFITPYRVSLTEKDLEFSQGDFNVDVVLALGVSRQEDFDEAITAHGRILHDATVASITIAGGAELGGLHWSEPSASSLSEIIVGLAHTLGSELFDQQIATALLTGIVSETDRFSNEKTSPQTMTLSAELMAAGANQQLVATQLEKTSEPAANKPVSDSGDAQTQTAEVEPNVDQVADGTLEIDHDSIDAVLKDLEDGEEHNEEEPVAEDAVELPEPVDARPPSRLIMEPPSMSGTLTANSTPDFFEPVSDSAGLPVSEPPALYNSSGLPITDADVPPSTVPAHDVPEPALLPVPLAEPAQLPPAPVIVVPPAPVVPSAPQRPEPLLTGFTPPPPAWIPATQDETNQLTPVKPTEHAPFTVDAPDSTRTLAEIEAAVLASEQAQPNVESHIDDARDQVLQALNSQTLPTEPVQSLGAQPLGEPLRPAQLAPQPLVPPQPPAPFDPNAPPPVPPPIPFNFGTPPPPQQ